MRELKFPVLKYTPKFIRGGIQTGRDLLVVGERNFEQGCFDAATIIDASGYKYQVLSATRKGLTWNPLNVFRAYRTILVDLELSNPDKLNADQVREEIFGVLFSHPKWYRRYFETEQSIRAKLDNAKTVTHLINSISVYS